MLGLIRNFFSGDAEALSPSIAFLQDGDGPFATFDALQAIYFNNLTRIKFPGERATDLCYEECGFCDIEDNRDSAFPGNLGYEPSSNGTFVKKIVGGHTLITVPYIAIHWRWLALPVTLWIFRDSLDGPAFAVHGVRIASIYGLG